MLSLVTPQVPEGRVVFTPRLVARAELLHRGRSGRRSRRECRARWAAAPATTTSSRQLGGPDVPATGASLGIERILSLLPASSAFQRGRLDVAVTVMSEELAGESFALAAAARIGRAARQRLPGRVGQARQAAALGRRAGQPLVA